MLRHSDTTVLFMLHPFGEATTRRVLYKLHEVRGGQRSLDLRIIYMNPVFDFVREQSGWLERIGRRLQGGYRLRTAILRLSGGRSFSQSRPSGV